MNLEKLPLEKVFHFILGIVPGTSVLWMIYLRHPELINSLADNSFLGYRTKLSIFLVFSFLIGNSITAFLNSLTGGFAGAVGGFTSGQNRNTKEVAPWRDRKWRAAATKYLGEQAPADTSLISDAVLNLRLQLIQQFPEADQARHTDDLLGERLQRSIEDAEWASWYQQFHFELLQKSQEDFSSHIATGLTSNMRATAVSILIGTIFIPYLRTTSVYWICFAFIISGVFMTIIEIWQTLNYWSSLSKQMRFLLGK